MRLSAFSFSRKRRGAPWARVIIFVAAIALSVLVYALAGNGGSGSEDVSAGVPITCVSYNDKIYSVITVIINSASGKNITLFSEVCNGFGVSAVFFMDTAFIKKNTELVNNLLSSGHEIGLLLSDTSEYSRSGFMKFLANKNDEFFKSAGKYPKYCYISGKACKSAAEVINAYGQYYISYAAKIEKDKSDVIRGGIIAAVDLTDAENIYAFAREISAAMSKGLKPSAMKEFVKEYDILAES